MALRIKTKWRRRDRPRSLEEIAVAAAFMVWRVALASAKNLHEKDFVYDNDEQRVGVIREYLAFLVHVCDRRAYDELKEDERARFVTKLGLEAARHLQQNQAEIMGPGDYRGPFIELLNARMQDYAEFPFTRDEAGFQALRFFGDRVLDVMGESQTNRWVVDHIVAIDGPEAVRNTLTSLNSLLREFKGLAAASELPPRGQNEVRGED